jgi:hypothetical protein
MGVGRIHGPTTNHDGRTQLVMRDDRLTKRACELGVELLTPDDLVREIGFSRPRMSSVRTSRIGSAQCCLRPAPTAWRGEGPVKGPSACGRGRRRR